MGKFSLKFWGMKRSHDVADGCQQSKKSEFKSKRSKLLNMFRRDEKQKYADLISRYSSSAIPLSTDTESIKRRNLEVKEFTDSIKARESNVGLPSSSSTPFRFNPRSSDRTITLNDSSFFIINSPDIQNDAHCAVLRQQLSPNEQSVLRQKVKSVTSALDTRKDRSGAFDSMLKKYQCEGDTYFNEPSEAYNGYSPHNLEADSWLQTSITRDPMQQTILLDDSKTELSDNSKTVMFDETSLLFRRSQSNTQDLSSFISTRAEIHNADRSNQTVTFSSPRTERPYRTPLPHSCLSQTVKSPLTETLTRNPSQKQMLLAVQKHLSTTTTSPFASRDRTTVEEIDLTTPERSYSSRSVKVDLPPATAQYKENEEKLDRAISTDYITSLVEQNSSQNVLDKSRVEIQAKVREECAKTADIERELRTLTLSPAPVEPFITEYYPGCLEIEISSDEEEEEEEEVVDELLPSEEELDQFIASKIRSVSMGTELINKFSIPISRKDLETLSGLNWLNDEVMNFYFNLIQERSTEIDNYPKVYVYNTFFYSKVKNGVSSAFGMVKRWTRKVDIFDHDILLIPNHLEVHWTLTVVNVTAKKISYYDSMADGKINSKGALHMKNVLEYLKLEHQDKKKSPLPDGWILGTVGIDEDGNQNVQIPQQENGSDCGVFTCRFAESIARRSQFNFNQALMPYFRKRMMYEICSGKLVD